jgi:hypothetical protein
MTLERLETVIFAALAPDADERVDRAGRSTYDFASDALKLVAREENSAGVVPLMIAIATANLGKGTSWWLAYLGLFEQIEFLPRAAIQLMQFFLNTPPTKAEPRAYVLRFLAYIGSPIKWEALPVGLRVEELAAQNPLVVADALVWGRRYDDACAVISRALAARQITGADIGQMVERWTRVVPPADRASIDAIGRLSTSAAPRHHAPVKPKFGDAVATFGRNMRGLSRFYPPARRPAAEPARQYG